MEYEFRTEPFQHQLDHWTRCALRSTFALFWEQGLGKTKELIDEFGVQLLSGRVEGLLVLAPNNVHRMWADTELPAHLPEELLKRANILYYEPSKASGKRYQKLIKELLEAPLPILTMAYSAARTTGGHTLLLKLLRKRKMMYVLDEADNIKNWTKTTSKVVSTGRYAEVKRVATGTPITEKPFDCYYPMKFMDEDFWAKNGFGSLTAFKQYFGIWETIEWEEPDREQPEPCPRCEASMCADRCRNCSVCDARCPRCTQLNLPRYPRQRMVPRSREDLVAFRNLPDLRRILEPHRSRLLKAEVLDLPPKLYSKRYYEMNKEQTRAYRDLKEELMTVLDSGEFIAAPLAITQMLRFQQILAGFLPDPDTGRIIPLGSSSPKQDSLVEYLLGLGHKAIIWSRFQWEIENLCERLPGAVRYDGTVSRDLRARNIRDFQEGEAPFFVANPAAGATGFTLHKAKTVVYCTNSFSLTQRLQSEDRAHRIGLEHPVHYVDWVCPGTIDEYIIKSLRNKVDIASQVTGDQLKEWI